MEHTPLTGIRQLLQSLSTIVGIDAIYIPVELDLGMRLVVEIDFRRRKSTKEASILIMDYTETYIGIVMLRVGVEVKNDGSAQHLYQHPQRCSSLKQ